MQLYNFIKQQFRPNTKKKTVNIFSKKQNNVFAFFQYYMVHNKDGEGLITICETEKCGTVYSKKKITMEHCICVSHVN